MKLKKYAFVQSRMFDSLTNSLSLVVSYVHVVRLKSVLGGLETGLTQQSNWGNTAN